LPSQTSATPIHFKTWRTSISVAAMSSYSQSHRKYYWRNRETILKKKADHKATKVKPTFTELYQYICQNPGKTTNQIARHFNVYQTSIIAKLATCENHGLLVYQNEDGALFPYEGCQDEW